MSSLSLRLPFPTSLAFPSLFSVFPSFSFGFLPYPPVSSILASLPLRRVPLDKGRGGIVPQTWKARQEPESPNLVTLHPDLFVVTNSGTDDLSLNSLVISFFIWNIETESWKGSHSHSIYRFTTSWQSTVYLSLQVELTTSCNSLLHFLSILEGLLNTEQKTPPWDFYPLGHCTFTNGISTSLFKRLNCFPHSYVRMRSLTYCWPQNQGDSKEMCLLLLWSLGDRSVPKTPRQNTSSWRTGQLGVGRGDTAEFGKHNSLVLGIATVKGQKHSLWRPVPSNGEKELWRYELTHEERMSENQTRWLFRSKTRVCPPHFVFPPFS